MGWTRAPGGRRSEQDITLEEAHSEDAIAPKDLDRMCELLARWARTRGQLVPEQAGVDLNNRVTPDDVRGYDGNQEPN